MNKDLHSLVHITRAYWGGIVLAALSILVDLAPVAAAKDRLPPDFSIELTSRTDGKLRFLSKVDPQPEYRLYRAKWEKDNQGRYTWQPNAEGLEDLERAEGLSRAETQLLAQFILARDQMAQLFDGFAKTETSYRAVLEMPDSPEKTEVLQKKEAFQREFKKDFLAQVAALTDDATRSFRALEKTLGAKRCEKVFEGIQDRSSQALKQQVRQVDRERARQVERCQRGLRECKFPRRLVENCAAYLNIPVETLRQRCPNPGKLEDEE